MKRVFMGGSLAFLLLVMSCNRNGEMEAEKNLATAPGDVTEMQTTDEKYKEEDGATADSTANGFGGIQQPVKRTDETLVKTDWDKKIVKSARLNMEVKDFKSFSSQVAQKVKQYGGYISHEQQSNSDYKIETDIVIRVPVEKFDDAIADLIKGAGSVNEKLITAEDQTREFVDGRSRLEAKKQVRLRYLDLLKQAKNMSEIIQVQQEINGIQEEIELVSGRINQINATAAMSSINLTYFQILDSSAAVDTDSGFFSRIGDAFAKGWHWIGELLIGLSSIWPLLIALIAGWFFFRKKLLTEKKVA
jgi:hypothetical protein